MADVMTILKDVVYYVLMIGGPIVVTLFFICLCICCVCLGLRFLRDVRYNHRRRLIINDNYEYVNKVMRVRRLELLNRALAPLVGIGDAPPEVPPQAIVLEGAKPEATVVPPAYDVVRAGGAATVVTAVEVVESLESPPPSPRHDGLNRVESTFDPMSSPRKVWSGDPCCDTSSGDEQEAPVVVEQHEDVAPTIARPLPQPSEDDLDDIEMGGEEVAETATVTLPGVAESVDATEDEEDKLVDVVPVAGTIPDDEPKEEDKSTPPTTPSKEESTPSEEQAGETSPVVPPPIDIDLVESDTVSSESTPAAAEASEPTPLPPKLSLTPTSPEVPKVVVEEEVAGTPTPKFASLTGDEKEEVLTLMKSPVAGAGSATASLEFEVHEDESKEDEGEAMRQSTIEVDESIEKEEEEDVVVEDAEPEVTEEESPVVVEEEPEPEVTEGESPVVVEEVKEEAPAEVTEEAPEEVTEEPASEEEKEGEGEEPKKKKRRKRRKGKRRRRKKKKPEGGDD